MNNSICCNRANSKSNITIQCDHFIIRENKRNYKENNQIIRKEC